MPDLTPRRRRVLVFRHRDRAWQEALDRLFDTDGLGLLYGLCLADEGVGTAEQALASFEGDCTTLLAELAEARPAEVGPVRTRWEAWRDDQRRLVAARAARRRRRVALP